MFMVTNYLKEYTKEYYDTDIIINKSDMNIYYDMEIHTNKIITMELKTRYFNDNTKKYILEDDILIELIQGLKTLKLDMKDITVKSCCTAVGWFYKCKADRLFYIKLLNGQPVSLIDINYKQFFYWFNNNLNQFKLHYSNKTTETYNAKVLIKDIPNHMYNVYYYC